MSVAQTRALVVVEVGLVLEDIVFLDVVVVVFTLRVVVGQG